MLHFWLKADEEKTPLFVPNHQGEMTFLLSTPNQAFFETKAITVHTWSSITIFFSLLIM